MRKHTEGPWAVEFEDKWPWSIVITPNILTMPRIAYGTANKGLDDVRNATAFNYGEREKIAKMVAEQEANALLIAAAPDLLEALVEVLDCLGFMAGGDHELEGHGISSERGAEIRLAIAKAKGDV